MGKTATFSILMRDCSKARKRDQAHEAVFVVKSEVGAVMY